MPLVVCEARPVFPEVVVGRPENAVSELAAYVRELREGASGDDPMFWETYGLDEGPFEGEVCPGLMERAVRTELAF